MILEEYATRFLEKKFIAHTYKYYMKMTPIKVSSG